MSNHEHNEAPNNYGDWLEAELAELQMHGRQMELHEDAMKQTWSRVSRLIKEHGIPEEAKFAVAAFGGDPTDPQKTQERLAKLRELDEAVRNHAGQITVWLTTEEEVTSHPFNPSVKPMTQKNYHLHVGMLPEGARLVVESPSSLSIPIEKSVCIPIVGYYHDEHLSLENEIIPHPAMGHVYEPRLEDRPGIDIRQWSNELPFPAVFGDEGVNKLLEDKGLKKAPEVNKALDALTSTLF